MSPSPATSNGTSMTPPAISNSSSFMEQNKISITGVDLFFNQAYLESKAVSDAKSLMVELCRQFYVMGWFLGTGGSISIKAHDNFTPRRRQVIVMSPSVGQRQLDVRSGRNTQEKRIGRNLHNAKSIGKEGSMNGETNGRLKPSISTENRFEKLSEEIDFDKKWIPLVDYLSTFGLKSRIHISSKCTRGICHPFKSMYILQRRGWTTS